MAHAPTQAGKADTSVVDNDLGTPAAEADARLVVGIPAAALEAAGTDPADPTEADPVQVDSAAVVVTDSEADAPWDAPAVADQAVDARGDHVAMTDSAKTNANAPRSHPNRTLSTRTTRS